MQRLAPSAGTGFARAHFWVARDLVEQDLGLNEQVQRQLEYHLQQSSADETLAPEAYASIGDTELGSQHRRLTERFRQSDSTANRE